MGEAIKAYRGVTATEEFKNLEWLRAKARNDEANALNFARKQGEKQGRKERDKHWQGVVAKKDTVLAEKDKHWQGVVNEKDKLIAKLQSQLNNNN